MGRNPDYSSGTPMSRTSGSIAYCGQAESSRTGRLWNGPPICCGRFTSRHFYLSRSERLGFALGVPQPALSARNPHALPTDWADERGLSDRSALRGLLCESQWLLSVVEARTKFQSASAGRSYFGRGVQYASAAYRKLLKAHGVIASMSRKGCCYDNAAMEVFFCTLKLECVYRSRFETHAQAQREIFSFYRNLLQPAPPTQCAWLSGPGRVRNPGKLSL
jgi:hypothetical protein